MSEAKPPDSPKQELKKAWVCVWKPPCGTQWLQGLTGVFVNTTDSTPTSPPAEILKLWDFERRLSSLHFVHVKYKKIYFTHRLAFALKRWVVHKRCIRVAGHPTTEDDRSLYASLKQTRSVACCFVDKDRLCDPVIISQGRCVSYELFSLRWRGRTENGCRGSEAMTPLMFSQSSCRKRWSGTGHISTAPSQSHSHIIYFTFALEVFDVTVHYLCLRFGDLYLEGYRRFKCFSCGMFHKGEKWETKTHTTVYISAAEVEQLNSFMLLGFSITQKLSSYICTLLKKA